MKNILKDLLDRLEVISQDHEELFDSEVRQKMSNAIVEAFVRRRTDYMLPDNFGMFSDKSNEEVKSAITKYISDANQKADEIAIYSFHDRLNAVQDGSVQSIAGNDYDEFLGHSSAEIFDEMGDVIRTQ